MNQRRFERAALGAPAVPPGRVTVAANALRRWLAGGHRRSAPPPVQILESLFAAFDTPVLGAIVALDLPDLLDKPRSVGELANRTGSDPDRLERVLRYAAGRGFVSFTRSGLVKANGVTTALRSEAEAPWRAWVQFMSSPWLTATWPRFGASLATGRPSAFVLAHESDYFTYLTVNPDAGAIFDEAMAAGAMLQAIGLARTLDWDEVQSVCDVGGGTGATLEVLLRYHPHLEVTLFDLPSVTERARFAETDGPPARTITSGSFFDEVPAGCDRYLLLAIVHDWDDDRATALLRVVAAALPERGRIVVVENVACENPRDDFASASDLLMLALASGRERTAKQYEALFAAAGLKIDRASTLPTGATAVELVRAD